ncbi:MAG: preprotein translocase subunit SecG [Defluviitaleaceae bacterium]|nr:preprotein translocase subunit SecG [Defluviitaleaceae bacterium]
MSVLYMILAGVYFLVALALIIVILAQQKKSSGLGGAMGGMGSSPSTYWEKNKGRSKEGILHRYTKILGALLIILSVVLTVI